MKERISRKVFLAVIFVIFFSTSWSLIVKADVYSDLEKEYISKGYKESRSTSITRKVGDVQYTYKIGSSNISYNVDFTVANVYYLAQNKATIRSVYHLTQTQLGEGNRQVEVTSLNSAQRHSFKDKRGKKLEDSNGNIVKIVKDGKYVMEFRMGPSKYTETIEVNVNVWNNSSETLDYGVIYGHDTELGENYGSTSDTVPVYSLGPNRGLYIETENKKYRLNYTVERYKKPKRVNYAGVSQSNQRETGNFIGFSPYGPLGAGNGDEAPYDPSKPLMRFNDTAVLFKVNPEKIKSGDKNGFTFYVGIEEGLTRPLIFTDESKYNILEGTPNLLVEGEWHEFNKEGGIITASLMQGSTEIADKQTVNFGTSGEGRFAFDLKTKDLPVGEYVLKLKIISDKTKQFRDLNVPITVTEPVKIRGFDRINNQWIPGDPFSVVESEVDTNYDVRVPLIFNSKYILDKTTPGLQSDGQTVKGKITQSDIEAKSVKVNYYPVPEVTVESPEYSMTETDNNVLLSGKWTDVTKSGGKIEIKKGNEILGSTTFRSNSESGNWSVRVPKEKLAIGKTDVSVVLTHTYSSYVASVSTSIYRQKQVKVNYYFKNSKGEMESIPEELLKGLPRLFDKRLGEVITIEAKEFLDGKKYSFDPVTTEGASGTTVKKTVTTTLNEMKIYYTKSSEIPVEIRYENKDNGRPILENLESDIRKKPRELGGQEEGTEIESLLQTKDKEAAGYIFDSIQAKKGDTVITDGKVGDEATVITIYFKPILEIKASDLDFGKHEISFFESTVNVLGSPELDVINTVENAAGKLVPCKLTGEFTGFETKSELDLSRELKYGDESFADGQVITIMHNKTPTIGKTSLDLKNRMKLNINGIGLGIGKYEGTITWTLVDGV